MKACARRPSTSPNQARGRLSRKPPTRRVLSGAGDDRCCRGDLVGAIARPRDVSAFSCRAQERNLPTWVTVVGATLLAAVVFGALHVLLKRSASTADGAA